jgi:hypothetical protein
LNAGHPVDRATQRWVVATGRRISFTDHPWLDGPVGAPQGIGEQWIDEHAAATGATVASDSGGGLLPDLTVLEGPTFRTADLHPDVRAFYEHTAAWQLDVWSRWRRWAEPGGRLMNAVFARRLRQLSLPLDPLETAHGMDSRVLSFRSPTGAHLGTAWQRTLRATGATVFGGFYGVVSPPAAAGPSVRVVFPLPNGSVTVILRPEVGPGGGLRLLSPHGAFGGEGAYLVVRPERAAVGWVRRVPLPERFDVYVDARGELRCDHRLCLGPAELLRLHYRMRRDPPPDL